MRTAIRQNTFGSGHEVQNAAASNIPKPLVRRTALEHHWMDHR
jgi:hypothetical protein